MKGPSLGWFQIHEGLVSAAFGSKPHEKFNPAVSYSAALPIPLYGLDSTPLNQ